MTVSIVQPKNCIFKFKKGQTIYSFEYLEINRCVSGYDYTAKVLINNNTYYLYCAEIPNRNWIMGWRIGFISQKMYTSKTKVDTFLQFLGETSDDLSIEEVARFVIENM